MSPEDSVFITPSANVLTSFNSTETITCTAKGGPNNMFEWSKQGVIVSNSDVLELTMITGSDGGLFVCNVTNDAGYGTANTSVTGMYSILLLLEYTATICSLFRIMLHNSLHLVAPYDVSVTGNNVYSQGEQLVLNCQSNGGPQLDYAWMFSSSEIGTSPTLTINNVNGSNGGDYTCIVTNDAGYDSDTISVCSK